MFYPLLWAGAAVLIAGGYFFDKTGEGVNDTGSGVMKIGATAAVLYVGAKYFKVIK